MVSFRQVHGMTRTCMLVIALVALLLHAAVAFTSTAAHSEQKTSLSALASLDKSHNEAELSRRSLIMGTTAAIALSWSIAPQPAVAKPDCFTDCNKNCKLLVPNDTSNYCRDSCLDYCSQPDRRDGLSGSVSSEGGEVGILGGTFGQGTVVKGEDKPPIINLPGLNFNSGEGRKLIG
jgi:hypothetical protein